MPLTYWAQVTGAWSSSHPDILQELDELHIWGPGFLDARLKWRKTTPLTLMEVRCYRLDEPYTLRASEDLWGCFSWLAVPGVSPDELLSRPHEIPAPFAGPGGEGAGSEPQVVQQPAGRPALEEAAFAAKQEILRSKLGRLEAVPLPLHHKPLAAVAPS